MGKRARSSLAAAFEELKYKDSASDSTALAVNSAAMLNIVNLTQGSTATGRVGQKVAVEKIDCEFLIPAQSYDSSWTTASGAGTLPGADLWPRVVHFMVVVDKAWSSGAGTYVPFIEASGTQSVFTRLGKTRQLVRDLDFTKRYRILGIKTVVVKPYTFTDNVQSTATYHTSIYPEIKVKMSFNLKSPIIVEYGAGSTSGSLTNIDVNMIGMQIYNDSDGTYFGGSATIDYAMSARVRYYD